nr:hypothetical protein [Bradyrhizobium sp. JYMT SZCCT0180]
MTTIGDVVHVLHEFQKKTLGNGQAGHRSRQARFRQLPGFPWHLEDGVAKRYVRQNSFLSNIRGKIPWQRHQLTSPHCFGRNGGELHPSAARY